MYVFCAITHVPGGMCVHNAWAPVQTGIMVLVYWTDLCLGLHVPILHTGMHTCMCVSVTTLVQVCVYM